MTSLSISEPKILPGSYNCSRLWLRARRVHRLLRDTGETCGRKAVLLLLARILWRKVPLLVRGLRAAGRTAKVRTAISQMRDTAVAPEPLLAFVVSGGLGDCLVMARFVRDLVREAGNLRFDVFAPTPQRAAWVFGTVPGFHAAYHDIAFERTVACYDASIRLNQLAVVYAEHVRWQVVREHPALAETLQNLIRFHPKIEPFAERHPWLDNFLGRTAVFMGATRRDFLHLMAGLPYGGDVLTLRQDPLVLARHGLRPGGYITVHNGFDAGFVISGRRATKCYPHFGAVVARLRTALPQIRFVQVGTVTSQPIPECDLVLLDQTSLDDAAALIAHAALHIDNESGLVHMAACAGTKSVVIFGPSPSDYFGYPDNINIDPPVCGNCWWMTRTWMDACPKGFETPRCMTEQDPARVAERALAAMLPAAQPVPEASAAVAVPA